MNNEGFAKRIKELRIDNKITQGELADKLGITPTGVSYWESGKSIPNYDTLKKLSLLFNVSIDYLTGNEKEKTNESDILFRKIGKVSDKKKALLMDILNSTVDKFIDNEREN